MSWYFNWNGLLYSLEKGQTKAKPWDRAASSRDNLSGLSDALAFLYRAAVAAIGLTIVLLIEGGLMWWGEPNLTELLDNIHDYGYNNLILNMYKSDKKTKDKGNQC